MRERLVPAFASSTPLLKSTLTTNRSRHGSLPATAQQTGGQFYSSDGEKLGEVTQVGMHEGRQAVVAQLEPALSFHCAHKERPWPRGLDRLNESVVLRGSATADPVDVVRNSRFIS